MGKRKMLQQIPLFPEFPPAREGESGEITPVVKLQGREVELMSGATININSIIPKKLNDDGKEKPAAKKQRGAKKNTGH